MSELRPVGRGERRLLSVLHAAEPAALLPGSSLAWRARLWPARLYPILDRLERDGVVLTRWGAPPEGLGPRRRLYRLTAAGRMYARLATRR